jgi:hypothetical protein
MRSIANIENNGIQAACVDQPYKINKLNGGK